MQVLANNRPIWFAIGSTIGSSARQQFQIELSEIFDAGRIRISDDGHHMIYLTRGPLLGSEEAVFQTSHVRPTSGY
jgi:hypothetical protein